MQSSSFFICISDPFEKFSFLSSISGKLFISLSILPHNMPSHVSAAHSVYRFFSFSSSRSINFPYDSVLVIHDIFSTLYCISIHSDGIIWVMTRSMSFYWFLRNWSACQEPIDMIPLYHTFIVLLWWRTKALNSSYSIMALTFQLFFIIKFIQRLFRR